MGAAYSPQKTWINRHLELYSYIWRGTPTSSPYCQYNQQTDYVRFESPFCSWNIPMFDSWNHYFSYSFSRFSHQPTGNSVYTPCTPTNPRVEKSRNFPWVSQVKNLQESGKRYWGANGCPLGFGVDDDDAPWELFGRCSCNAKPLATDPRAGGGNGGSLKTGTAFGPELDASPDAFGKDERDSTAVAGATAFATVTLLWSAGTLLSEELAIVVTAPVAVLAFAITILGDGDVSERPGGGPEGCFGKFGNSTQEGGCSGSLGTLRSRASSSSASTSSSSHWFSNSPITSWRTVARVLLKKSSSSTKGYSFDNWPFANPCSRAAVFCDWPLLPERCQSIARQRVSPIEEIFAKIKRPI